MFRNTDQLTQFHPTEPQRVSDVEAPPFDADEPLLVHAKSVSPPSDQPVFLVAVGFRQHAHHIRNILTHMRVARSSQAGAGALPHFRSADRRSRVTAAGKENCRIAVRQPQCDGTYRELVLSKDIEPILELCQRPGCCGKLRFSLRST